MVCPKCGAPIKRFDLAPNCKSCGVHIMYYTQEKELSDDAKRTELEFAKARVFISKLKAAFIASPAVIARMILGVLSVAALLLPLGFFEVSLPYFDLKITIGALGIYKLISEGTLGLAPDLVSSGAGGGVTTLTACAVVFFLMCALCILALFFAWILSFTNIKKTAKAQCIIISLAVFFVLLAESFVIAASKSADSGSVISVSPCVWGAVGIIAEYIAFLITNIAILKNTPEITVNEVDKKRIEVFGKIKAGELTYDDLPVPIFETEEERLNRENAMAGVPKKKKTRKGGNKNEQK